VYVDLMEYALRAYAAATVDSAERAGIPMILTARANAFASEPVFYAVGFLAAAWAQYIEQGTDHALKDLHERANELRDAIRADLRSGTLPPGAARTEAPPADRE